MEEEFRAGPNLVQGAQGDFLGKGHLNPNCRMSKKKAVKFFSAQ